jgi:hypothetical protein
MKKIMLAFGFITFSLFCNAQSQMTIKEDYWSGSAIYLNGNKISINEAKEFAKSNL